MIAQANSVIRGTEFGWERVAGAVLAATCAALLALPAAGQRYRAVRALDTWHRLTTSQERLRIHWERGSGGREKADSAPDALRLLSGRDPRPLLILRTSRDPSLRKAMDRAMLDERVGLCAHWFHCVRIAGDVARESHAYHALFEGRRAPHLVMATADGTKIVELFRTKSQKITWRKMLPILKHDYQGQPARAVGALVKLLSEFDRLDERHQELMAQQLSAQQMGQRDRVEAIEAQLKRLAAQRQQALAEEKKWRVLTLRSAAESGR